VSTTQKHHAWTEPKNSPINTDITELDNDFFTNADKKQDLTLISKSNALRRSANKELKHSGMVYQIDVKHAMIKVL